MLPLYVTNMWICMCVEALLRICFSSWQLISGPGIVYSLKISIVCFSGQPVFLASSTVLPLNPPQPFYSHFPGPPGWASARRELLDFMVQGEINRGWHTDHPAGRHSIRTNQCPPPPSPHIFYGPDAVTAAQPTVSKHWRRPQINW